MSASDKKKWLGWAGKYAYFSLGCLIFGAVYECFSHGVFSLWMGGMFAWPLILGMIPCLVMGRKGYPLPRHGWRYGAAVITWTAGSCMEGVFEIYGSSSPYLVVYWAAGGLMMLWALWGFVFSGRKNRKDLA